MSTPIRLRLPISTRHAFALAFDLAARRDPLHSLIVPLLLRAPWNVALALLPPITQTEHPVQVTLLTLAALLGDFIMLLTVSAMLRFRARSVFNTPVETRPGAAGEHYALALRRVPWLLATEVLRNLALLFSSFFLLLPALLLGFRLAFATEAVVLNEPDTSSAFRRSFHLTEGRFERWLEMIVVSVVLIFAIILFVALLTVVIPGPAANTWVSLTLLLITAITPIIQYAWTFFYLRLVETEPRTEPVFDTGPAYAAGPVPPEPQVATGPIDPPPLSIGPGEPAGNTG